MTAYAITVGFYVSQVIDVEADDYETAMAAAIEQIDLPNDSNLFVQADSPQVVSAFLSDGSSIGRA